MDVLPLCHDDRSSTIPSQLSDQGHFQELKASAAITDSMTPSEPFLFFRPPAELGVMIYRLLVDTVVRNMHRWEFKKSQGSGAYQSRSTYLAIDHACKPDFKAYGYPNIRSCLVKDTRFGPIKTTYTHGTPRSTETMTTTMLSLDKQSREEVASIFYGENTFHFTTISTLTPFIKDHTAETRKYIQSLQLTLAPNGQNQDTIFTEQGISAMWNRAFSSFLKLSYTNIKKAMHPHRRQKRKDPPGRSQSPISVNALAAQTPQSRYSGDAGTGIQCWRMARRSGAAYPLGNVNPSAGRGPR